MEKRKQPSKEALENCVKVLVPYIVEMIKKDKMKQKKEPPTH